MKSLSVVLSVYNADKTIRDALESVKDIADEIIVVDHYSIDNTVKKEKKYTICVYKQENRPLQIDLQKNYGFGKAQGDWILCLDADEKIGRELAKEIKTAIAANKSAVNGYWIPRKNIIFGKWIKNKMWWPDYQLRLFRRGKGKYVKEGVHNYIRVEGRVDKLKEPMEHLNYSSITQFVERADKIYTENEAENLIASGAKLIWIDALRYPLNDFLRVFFAREAYKDGLHGLVLSLLQAFYSLLVFAKVWEKQGFRQENHENFLREIFHYLKKNTREYYYWFLSSFAKETRNPFKKLWYRILSKM